MSKGAGGGHNKGAKARTSPEEITRMYWDQEWSQWKIAAHFGVTQGAVLLWMRDWKIPTRTKAESLRLSGARERFRGSNNPKWSGGRHIANGYSFVRMPGHPKADNRGYVREHVLVYLKHIGAIPEGWHVHHKNGIKTDNRPENLEAMPLQKHLDVIPELFRRIAELEEELRRLKSCQN